MAVIMAVDTFFFIRYFFFFFRIVVVGASVQAICPRGMQCSGEEGGGLRFACVVQVCGVLDGAGLEKNSI